MPRFHVPCLHKHGTATDKNVALYGQSTMRPLQDGPTTENNRQAYCMYPDYRIQSGPLLIRNTGSA